MKKRFFLIFISLILALAAGELILSGFYPQKTYSVAYKNAISCFTKSETTVFTLKPGCTMNFTDYETNETFAARTNSLGYRGKEFELIKKPGEKRILVEGDSFVLGFGVKDEDLMTARLEEKLNIQVINAGYAGGFGPDGYFLHLLNKGMALEPDLTIFSVFVYNDLTDLGNDDWIGTGDLGQPQKVVSKTTFVDDQGYLMPKSLPFIYTIPLIRESQLAILSAKAWEGFNQSIRYWFDKVRYKISPPKIPSGDARDSNLPGPYINACIFADNCHRQVMHLYTDLMLLIKASDRLVESQYSDSKPHFAVLLIPADFQLYPGRLKKYNDNGIPLDIVSQKDPNPQRLIKKMLDSEKIPYIDLLPAFRKIKDNLYFEKDGHWNSKGHVAAAEEVYQWIEKNWK